MRLVRMVRKGPGGLEMIEVFPSEDESKKAENFVVIKVREGEDRLEVYRCGRQAAEKPVPTPAPPDSDIPPAETDPAEVLATKSEEELKIIAKEYGVEKLEAGKDDLILDILTKAGYQVERVPKEQQPQQVVQDQQASRAEAASAEATDAEPAEK